MSQPQFATDLERTPLRDLAHLGGWKSGRPLLMCYQQPDPDLQRRLLEGLSQGVPPRKRTPESTPGHLRLVK